MVGEQRSADEETSDERVAEAEQQIRESGVIPLAQLTGGLPSRAARAALVDALVERGLEKAAKVMRVPLTEQLMSLLKSAREVPLATLHEQLAGASAAEAKRAALALAAAGELALVKSGRNEVLTRLDGQVIDAEQAESAAESLAKLKALVKELDKRVPAGKAKPKYALLRDELADWRQRVRAAVAMSWLDAAVPNEGTKSVPIPAEPESKAVEPAAAGSNSVGERVFSTLSGFDRDPLLHLVYLPDLVRALGRQGIGMALVHEALLAAVDRGEIELKPENEPERLRATDRTLCMTTPSGRLISWVRLPQGA